MRPLVVALSASGRDLFITHYDSPSEYSVMCVQLYPTRLKWKKSVSSLYKIWFIQGLLYLRDDDDLQTKSIRVLSAADGQDVGQIQCHDLPKGVAENEDGKIMVISYNLGPGIWRKWGP